MDKVSSNLSLFIIFSVAIVTGCIGLSVISAFATVNTSTSTNADSIEENTGNSNLFSVKIFTEPQFKGNNITLTKNVTDLKEYDNEFDNSINSIIVPPHGNNVNEYVVEVCEHPDYEGHCLIFGPGEYGDIETFGLLNDQISSIRQLHMDSLQEYYLIM